MSAQEEVNLVSWRKVFHRIPSKPLLLIVQGELKTDVSWFEAMYMSCTMECSESFRASLTNYDRALEDVKDQYYKPYITIATISMACSWGGLLHKIHMSSSCSMPLVAECVCHPNCGTIFPVPSPFCPFLLPPVCSHPAFAPPLSASWRCVHFFTQVYGVYVICIMGQYMTHQIQDRHLLVDVCMRLRFIAPIKQGSCVFNRHITV